MIIFYLAYFSVQYLVIGSVNRLSMIIDQMNGWMDKQVTKYRFGKGFAHLSV